MPAQLQSVYDTVLKGIGERNDRIVTSQISVQDFQLLIYALKYDNPQLFYVDFNGVQLLQSPVACTFLLHYFVDEAGQKKIENDISAAISPVLEAVTGKPLESAALTLHDWLLGKACYGECDEFPEAGHNIVGALICSKCVCEGYAKAYKYLADRIGLRCIVVTGENTQPDGSTGGHAWNIVRLGGTCYHVDVTFDAMPDKRYCSKAYFLLSDKELSADHNNDKSFKLPDCPDDGKALPVVSGTADLIRFLREEHRSGAAHSEVRLTKGFTNAELISMIRKKLSVTDIFWCSSVKSYCYRDYSRTLFVYWS